LFLDQILKQGRSIPRNENADFVEVVLPNKLDPYKSYGVKLISLFARLMFSSESHSLTDLSRMLGCSKQTVLRLVDDIRRAYGVEIEESIQERRKYFRLKKRVATPALSLSPSEITVLQMCKAFAEHLLGAGLLKEAAEAIDKNRAQLPSDQRVPGNHFAVLPYGGIDYTPHQETLRSLIWAMGERKVCKVNYRAAYDGRAKTFFIKPLKLFSHKDCLYLSSKMARYPGRAYHIPDFDPLLAVHRITKIELTGRNFEYPKNYSFEARFNGDFGVIKDEPFEVEVEFKDWAARFVSERVWSPDQRVIKKKDGTARLRFKTSSEPETISWILSFSDGCKLLKPKWLIKDIAGALRKIGNQYNLVLE
jgi:predicted DNA-binding transcriptional regulator YafY